MKALLLRRKSFIAVIVLMIAGALCGSARRSGVSDEDRRKAAYVYMDALSAFMDENYNLYSQLIDRAYNLDPTDPDIKMSKGEWNLVCAMPTDTATIDEAFRMIFSGYTSNADNYFDGTRLLNLTSKFRRWDDNLKVAEIMAERFPNRNEVQLALGQVYLLKASLGDTAFIPRALGVFNSLEERLGKSYDISELKIRTHAVSNDTAAIVDELVSLNESSPDDPFTSLAVAQFYNSVGVPGSARRFFNHACELDSTYGPAIMLRARFLEQQGDSTAFEREALRAVKSPDVEFESKVNFIVNYIRTYSEDSTQHSRIDNLFEALLDVNSGEPDVYRLYGEYLAHIGKPEQAAEQKDFAKAADVLGRASHYFSDDPMIARGEAVYLSLSDDKAKAITVLENFPDSIITDNQQRAEMLSTLGDLYYADGRKDDAFRIYEQSLSLDPYNDMALNNVAYFYAETDTLLDVAADYIRRVMRHQPDNPTYIDTYAWVLFKKGDYQAAREQIDLTLKLMNFESELDSLDTKLSADLPEGQLPDEAEAVEEFENFEDEAMDSSPSADVFEHAGDIYFRCGYVDDAVKFWKKALEKEPDNADSLREKIKHRKIIDQ